MYLIVKFIFYISDLTALRSYFTLKGHSPAGGCLMAMSCDYRIMVKGPYKIGLNETQLVSKLNFFWTKKIAAFYYTAFKRESSLRSGSKKPW
jgi:hypothetical protein